MLVMSDVHQLIGGIQPCYEAVMKLLDLIKMLHNAAMGIKTAQQMSSCGICSGAPWCIEWLSYAVTASPLSNLEEPGNHFKCLDELASF